MRELFSVCTVEMGNVWNQLIYLDGALTEVKPQTCKVVNFWCIQIGMAPKRAAHVPFRYVRLVATLGCYQLLDVALWLQLGYVWNRTLLQCAPPTVDDNESFEATFAFLSSTSLSDSLSASSKLRISKQSSLNETIQFTRVFLMVENPCWKRKDGRGCQFEAESKGRRGGRGTMRARKSGVYTSKWINNKGKWKKII